MLDYVIKTTADFLESMPKDVRKKKGQFFTSRESAEFMANLFDFSHLKGNISVLDPGAGTGILTAAFVDRILHENQIDSLNITCYENDKDVLPILAHNLEYIKQNVSIPIQYQLIDDDYILSQADDFEGTLLANKEAKKYDAIIGNPPYLRVMKDNPAALSMPTVVHGAPNLYFLFASMSLFNLKDDCEMVYIIPRSWTSGEYFKAFRRYFLENGKLENIHLFVSRDKVFNQEQVLQETIIIKAIKSRACPDTVTISSSNNNDDFSKTTIISTPYDSVVTGENLYVFLPTSQDEINTIRKVNRYSTTFPEVGFRMRTGIVVDFRQRNELRQSPGENIVPLFYSQHIKNGRVNHLPSGKQYDWIIDSKPGLIQKNENYVFCKRFTAKEEKRRLQCGVYLADDFPNYKFIGTQNKINYINRIDEKPLSKEEVFGIYVILNSTIYDQFYRILNGSTQVNSTEVNNMPVPQKSTIELMGKELLESEDLSTQNCDKILNREAYHE